MGRCGPLQRAPNRGLPYLPLSFPWADEFISDNVPFWPFGDFSPSQTRHLLWLGQQVAADFVLGVEYKINVGYVQASDGEDLARGWTKLWLTIIDVQRQEVVFLYWPSHRGIISYGVNVTLPEFYHQRARGRDNREKIQVQVGSLIRAINEATAQLNPAVFQ